MGRDANSDTLRGPTGSTHARNIRLNLCKLYDGPIRLLADHARIKPLARMRPVLGLCVSVCLSVHLGLVLSYCNGDYGIHCGDWYIFP